MEKDIYREQKTDMAKLVLRMKEKCWIPIAALLMGAVVFSAAYTVHYRVANGPMYQAVSKVYLDFAADETGEVYQYYNGYTWNDLMSTDPIIGATMETLTGIDRTVVERSTKAEILSDIRLLTITISNASQSDCERIQEATERSLEALGDSAKEFRDITVVKSVKPERIMADRRLPQAALLGAVMSFAVSFIWLLLHFVLDDTIFVPSDILGNLDVPFLGIEAAPAASEKNRDRYEKCVERFRQDLQSNTDYLRAAWRDSGQSAVQDNAVFSGQPALLDIYDIFFEGTPIDYDALRNASLVVLQVQFGRISLRALHYTLNQLALQGCGPMGVVITGADAAWLCRYFGLSAKGRKAVGAPAKVRSETRRSEK